MAERIAVVTNATEYAGLPSALALAHAEFTVICHGRGFDEESARRAFTSAHRELGASAEQDPAALIRTVTQEHGKVDVVVSNDCCPARFVPIENASLDEYRATLEALLVTPFALVKAVAPQMKQRRGGRIILITSAGPISPYAELSMYISGRGGASSLAVALSKELGPFNITVNAVAPNFLQSEIYYPSEIWETNPTHRAYLEGHVPLGRLGRPEEIGELVAFLASGKCDFVNGQVIPFTGGWPGMPPWPGGQLARKSDIR
jgi:NAD(P)-dependent dehydrogenase (short-subunit alcohol dehydrogenase family)